MPKVLEGFVKRKDFLIGIDSDGCAMDTMDCKHILCFGPCLIPVWELEPWKEWVLRRWNEINLYTMTRGINRFKGLAIILKEIDAQWKKIPGADEFDRWTREAAELSNTSVHAMWEQTGNPVFAKALEWSTTVNQKIGTIPADQKKAFSGVKEALMAACEFADIAVVSSANYQAVVEEWKSQGLLDAVDILLSQDSGSKEECIRILLEKGYERSHVLMVGDAPGDHQAAANNGVCFFPILVKKETASWKEFVETPIQKLKAGEYCGAYQERKIREFKENLHG